MQGDVSVWDSNTGHHHWKKRPGSERRVFAGWSTHRECVDGTNIVWNVESGDEVCRNKQQDSVRTVSSDSNKVLMWNWTAVKQGSNHLDVISVSRTHGCHCTTFFFSPQLATMPARRTRSRRRSSKRKHRTATSRRAFLRARMSKKRRLTRSYRGTGTGLQSFLVLNTCVRVIFSDWPTDTESDTVYPFDIEVSFNDPIKNTALMDHECELTILLYAVVNHDNFKLEENGDVALPTGNLLGKSFTLTKPYDAIENPSITLTVNDVLAFEQLSNVIVTFIKRNRKKKESHICRTLKSLIPSRALAGIEIGDCTKCTPA